MTERRFPVLHGEGASVAWTLLEPHARQAFVNHGQNLETLAARGGLDWVELLAVLEDKRLHEVEQDADRAAERVLQHVVRHSGEQYRLAIDLAAESYGQAAWQEARRRNPRGFWEAKVRIDAGPRGMRVTADAEILSESDWRFRFEWHRDGKRERIDFVITKLLLSGEETYLPEDEALRHHLARIARDITKHTGVETSLTVRSNRAALAEMERLAHEL